MGARGTVAGERRRDARHGRRRGRGGYSLVEASITLAVVGIMGAIAVPSLRALLPRLRLANDTEVLMKEIGLARRQAIARSEAACIAFALRDQGADPAARDAYAFGRWVGGACVAFAASELAQTDIESVTGFTLPSVSPAVATPTLVIQGNGAVNVPPLVPGGGAPNAGFVTLRTPSGDRGRRIRVDPLGRVTLQHREGGGAWVDD